MVGVKLPKEAEVVLERNRVAYARRVVQECKEATLDLSGEHLGDPEAGAIAEELSVCVFLDFCPDRSGLADCACHFCLNADAFLCISLLLVCR